MQEQRARRARLLLVIDEVRAGRLTRPAAARALDMTLDEFLIEAGQHGLYAIDHDIEDFKRELGAIPKGEATRSRMGLSLDQHVAVYEVISGGQAGHPQVEPAAPTHCAQQC